MDSLNLIFGLKVMKTNQVPELAPTRTAIVFASQHGTSSKIADMLKEFMTGEQITLIDLQKQKSPDLSQFDRMIVGSSIHYGKIRKEVKAFCEQNEQILLQKECGLYLCCMYDGEKAREQFDHAYSATLRMHAKSKALLGFELYFDRMNILERAMTKKITGLSGFISQINHAEINRFAREMCTKSTFMNHKVIV